MPVSMSTLLLIQHTCKLLQLSGQQVGMSALLLSGLSALLQYSVLPYSNASLELRPIALLYFIGDVVISFLISGGSVKKSQISSLLWKTMF